MTDDDFVPRPVQAPQRAIPVGPASGKPAGVQQSGEGPGPFTLAVDLRSSSSVSRRGEPVPDPTRSARAKRSWQTRRKAQRDRHVVGDHPFDAALEELYRQRDALNAGIEVLEKLKGEKHA